jgi:hypothetical protein
MDSKICTSLRQCWFELDEEMKFISMKKSQRITPVGKWRLTSNYQGTISKKRYSIPSNGPVLIPPAHRGIFERLIFCHYTSTVAKKRHLLTPPPPHWKQVWVNNLPICLGADFYVNHQSIHKMYLSFEGLQP